MKSFNEFYISSKRVFWAINISFAILVVLLIGYIFRFELKEIYLQLAIAIVMTFVLVWMLGGYDNIRLNYLERQKKNEQ